MRELEESREILDGVDDSIVALVNARAKLVAAIAEVKRATGVSSYDPDRERTVIARAVEKSAVLGGVLPGDSVRRIFEAILRETKTEIPV